MRLALDDKNAQVLSLRNVDGRNRICPSLVNNLKRDYLRQPDGTDSTTVMDRLKVWFEHYNDTHPYCVLKYVSPRLCRERQLINQHP